MPRPYHPNARTDADTKPMPGELPLPPFDTNAQAGRPVSVDIDLSAVSQNAQMVKRIIGPDCRLMAVVKANGYGLGATWIAQAAIEGGATQLAVACVDEGVELRRAGFTCPILVMSYGSPLEAHAAIENKLTLAVHRMDIAAALEAAASQVGMPYHQVPIHIKVDTGLGRFGCLPGEFLSLAQFVRQCRHLRLEGLMTHFAEADAEDLSFAHEQLERFSRVRQEAQANGITFDIVHAANSAATLALPKARFDMVRVGMMLNGHFPCAHLRGALPLQPAVRWHTRLIRVFDISVGESVGYGRTWTAQRPSTIGLIPVGYADGYPRLLSNTGAVLVHGQRCPIAGRISMDQVGVDLTDIGGVREGDEVVLIGKQGDEEIATEEVAEWAETITYELFSGLAARVPKRYFRDGQTIGVCNLLGSAQRLKSRAT